MVTFAPWDVNMNYADFGFKAALRQPQSLDWWRSRDLKVRTRMTELMLEGWPQGEALTNALDASKDTLWVMAENSTTHADLDNRAATGGQFGGYGAPARQQPARNALGKMAKRQAAAQRRNWANAASYGVPPPPPAPWQRQQRQQQQPDKGRGNKGEGKGKGKNPKGYGKGGKGIVNKLPGDVSICKAWNVGQCSSPCQRTDYKGAKMVHVCNFQMPDGSACGRTDHQGYEHVLRMGR